MEDDILQGFLEESWENLGQLDSDIVAFEKNPGDDELLASVFRTIHTIKGTCGFIGLVRIGAVAHAAENVLGKMRDRGLERSTDAISLVLEAVDALKDLLHGLEANGVEPDLDFAPLIAQLELIASQRITPSAKSAPLVASGAAIAEPARPRKQSASNSQGSPPASTDAVVEITASDLLNDAGEVDFDALDRAIDAAAARHREQRQQQKPAARDDSAGLPGSRFTAVPVAGEKQRLQETGGDASDKKSISDLSIRVNVTVLDRLMNLVGELVLARNQLLQLSRGDEDSKYAAPLTHLNRVTTDLQEGVMKTRMQPIGTAWNKLPRLVRDLANVTGKQIELVMTGADTELDRTVLDAIKDPLTHMVRNSADHGLELPSARVATGKSEKGTIRLNAYHEGGHVIICIEDDGAGINTAKVLQRMIQQGLVTEAEADSLSEYEIHQYIFRAGFSTADVVSSVSGRGVGMDVVRTAIERIGGTVDLSSRRGRGTTVRIKIPLTLAIISALVVESGGQSFAIPQIGIVELVRLAAEDKSRIERVHDRQVFRLRNRLLPLVHLSDVLQIPSGLRPDSDVNIIVVQIGEEQLGLIVDRVFDTEEIVVKPVGHLLKSINIYQGTTILGDGRVIMILDPSGIASEFGSIAAGDSDREATGDQERLSGPETTSLLVFDAGRETTMAVPLSLVSRLEELPAAIIEQSSNGPVAQYRGSLLPLLSLSGSPGEPLLNPQPVIVFSDGEQSMGLMVNAIKDVVQEHLAIALQSQRAGVLGTAIIDGKATEVIDTQHYLLRTNPNWFRKSHQSHYHILVVNSSAFFRQLLVTTLQSERYLTTAVDSAETALTQLEKDNPFDLIIVDFDQRDLNVADLIAWVHEQQSTAALPVLGLCSRRNAAMEQQAVEAGCQGLLEKLDLAELNNEIERLCGQRRRPLGVSA